MMHEITIGQLSGLHVDPHAPLLICDVDEVIVHFTSDFEKYLADQKLALDTSTYALHGNIRHVEHGGLVSDDDVSGLIDEFFVDRTRHMEPIEGAVEALLNISKHASVVMLTNLPHSAGDDRRANLINLGLPFPVVTNSGPKGPAIKNLESRTKAPVIFVDDNPNFVLSSHAYAPEVHIVHFIQDLRYAHLIETPPFVSLRAAGWHEAEPHIMDILKPAR